MTWDVAQLQHNASMLYNHLCSDDADRVYVDASGHFQLDERSWFWRLFTSLGDSSRQVTDAVAIRTLRRVLNAIEAGTLDPNRIIIQERVPVGMFMDDDVDPSAPLVSDRPAPTWLNKDKFGMNIHHANRFRIRPIDVHPMGHVLTREEKVSLIVAVLTGQILFGKGFYRSLCRDVPDVNFYDVSFDES
jgi:hypothetical protein